MRFSFILAARNEKSTICAAIQSVLNQDYSDVEVIYIDDASTDGSADLVRQSFDDSRLILVEHNENCGILISRLEGLSMATGEWALFLDGDDCFVPQTCWVLAEAIGKADEDVEIFGFGTSIRYKSTVPDQIRAESERLFAKAVPGLLSGEQLLDQLYIQRNGAWVVWNRCYSMNLARRAAKQFVQERMIMLEDFYMSFIFASEAKRYQGLDAALYQYSYGAGVSTSATVSLESLENYLLLQRAIERTREYAKSRGTYEKYREAMDIVEQEGIIGVCWRLDQLEKTERSKALQMIQKYFNAEQLLSAMEANEHFSERVKAERFAAGHSAEDKIRSIFEIGGSMGIQEELHRLTNNFHDLPQYSSLYQYILWLNDLAEKKDPLFQEQYLPIIQDERKKPKDKRPFLTVVTRTQGKRPEMLRETLLSLAGQSDEDFELILVGHRLEEDARIVVQKIVDEQPAFLRSRIRLIEVDHGDRATPLNVGFAHAHGEYIAVLDDDDLVFDNWVEVFHESATENYGKIIHAYAVTQEWMTLAGESALRASSSFGTRYCTDFEMISQLTSNHCPLMSLAFPSYYFQELGIIFDEELTTTEDWDYLMRLSFLAGVADSRITTSIYRLWVNAENSQTLHNRDEWAYF